MASPYVLWQYFNLMLPYKQSGHLPQTPDAVREQQIMLNSQQVSLANLNYQHFQQQLMQQCIRPANNNPLPDNIYNNFGIATRSHFDFPHGISDAKVHSKFQPECCANISPPNADSEREKCTTPQSKQGNQSNRQDSPRRSLFTIDAILSKDCKEKALKSLAPLALHNPQFPHSSSPSQIQKLEESEPRSLTPPPCSPQRSEACSPLQDRLCPMPQPLMHSTPQQFNPSLDPDFNLGRFLPRHHPAHLYSLPPDPSLQPRAFRDDVSLKSSHLTHEQQQNEFSGQFQHHHHHLPHHHQQQQQQQYHHLSSQCLSSSSPGSTSASSASGQSSSCSDMSISSSSSLSKSTTDKQTRKSGTKSKRVRTIFTPEQLERLEAEFERQQYMVGTERFYLASSLNLSEAQVKVWFQNRRIKWRKQHLEQQQARLARGDLYRDLGPLEDEEELEDSRGESDMEEERPALQCNSTG